MSDWKSEWHIAPSLIMYGTLGAMALGVLSLAWKPEPDRVKCSTTGGPIPLGTERVTVPLKCCPPGMYVANPNQPALDKHDNLICVEET